MSGGIGKSYEPSDGHPFIIDNTKWIGTPWDADPEPPAEQTQAHLVAELHGRLEKRQNLSDLMPTARARASMVRNSEGGSAFPSGKKMSKKSKPTSSVQEQTQSSGGSAADVNPFTEALFAKNLPFEAKAPLVWVLPRGFSVKHMDGGHYLPLFVHGLRETKQYLGLPVGSVAFEVRVCSGACSSVNNQLRENE